MTRGDQPEHGKANGRVSPCKIPGLGSVKIPVRVHTLNPKPCFGGSIHVHKSRCIRVGAVDSAWL